MIIIIINVHVHAQFAMALSFDFEDLHVLEAKSLPFSYEASNIHEY